VLCFLVPPTINIAAIECFGLGWDYHCDDDESDFRRTRDEKILMMSSW
jgi:hypothetical protein